MFAISNSSEYGLLILEQVKDCKEYVPLAEIVKKLKLPKRFVARVSAELVKAGLLDSKEGRNGGYRLSEEFYKLTLLDYLKIFEKTDMVKCIDKNFKCRYSKNCSHKHPFAKIQQILLENLQQYKLSSII
ncbi:MAG: hypothetical protein KatS3mg090_0891 [Patescibacteria group bacterium]|nr:MAG: hypothetical protein KatS3mg090_0891 [Patescibacteria group bacterium]